MASQQQAYVADLIEAVKRKRARTGTRQPPVERPKAIYTNYGNKLDPEAQYVQQGRLDTPFGASTYRETIDYNGYTRNIRSRNPALVDPDGDLVDDDEDFDTGYASPIEDNIYKDVLLEEILQPLVAASDLPTHPSLSQPYYERGLPEMVKMAEETLHREQELLWKVKSLFTALRGDANWAPVGDFHDTYDDFLLGSLPQSTGTAPASTATLDYANGVEVNAATNGVGARTTAEQQPSVDDQHDATATASGAIQSDIADYGAGDHMAREVKTADVDMADDLGQVTGDIKPNNRAGNQQVHPGDVVDDHTGVNGTNGITNGVNHEMIDAPGLDGNQAGSVDDDVESQARSHRMTTRGQANQHSGPRSRSVSPSSSLNPVHPMFQFPSSTIPDYNMGLPSHLADECRAMVLGYVSKQEEVVRQTRQLHSGLLRALEMRRNVLKWCKADGHVGELSDGEDWYDKEEWGLDADLIKGKEEEEDDDRVGKKTRRAGRGENK